ncbi:Alpha/Beta hydrolase protein [Coniochaeta sp. 2T2.1]|nr:Alpha/Beta hydrolase protein [Coniochaeta sp. 2T2.1]
MSATSSPLAFVLVPGAFCLPTQFDRITPKLQQLGHHVEPIHLPTVGRAFFEKTSRIASIPDDAEHVNSTVASLADKGYNVVLVGSSYAGMVITEAARGLSRAERGPNTGALIGLVYLGSLLPPVGVTIAEIFGGKGPPAPSADAEPTFMDPHPVEVAAQLLHSDLPAEEALHYAGMVDVFSSRVNGDACTFAGWKTVPATVVIGSRDLAVKPDLGHEYVKRAVETLEAEGKPVTVKKVVIGADHMMMVSQPDRVVEILLEAAKAGL